MVEDALYDPVAMSSFVGIDLGVDGAPDETTVCEFQHQLERNKLCKMLLTAVKDHLHGSCIRITKGTIVGAKLIGAPISTKNQDCQRDPEMHQVAKCQQWYLGMKARTGVDSKMKPTYTMLASASLGCSYIVRGRLLKA